MIENFFEFIQESYLKGGRQPLYHYTPFLNKILESDELRISKFCHGKDGICLTRTPYFIEPGENAPRIVLDVDKLKKDGYNSFPVDEVGISLNNNKVVDMNHSKSNFNSMKAGHRLVHNNLGLPNPYDGDGLEYEYEERIHKNINNLGKYIISIELNEYNNNYISNINNVNYPTTKDG